MVHALAYGAQRILIGQRVRHDRGAGRDCATASLSAVSSAWQSLYSAVATGQAVLQKDRELQVVMLGSPPFVRSTS